MEAHKEYCSVCGNQIWSDVSVARGYGSECAAAIQKAKVYRVFHDVSDNSKMIEYYSIQATMLINLLAKMNFRSAFKKSFQKTVLNQKVWLSKKQLDIAKQIVFENEKNDRYAFELELKDRYDEFWQNIPVTRKDIEIARRLIRGEKIN